MPIYEYRCPTCNHEIELRLAVKDYTSTLVCQECKGDMQRHYSAAPNFVIPGNCTYNGITKVSGGRGSKQEARVPLNIIDENPDGSYKVTRIGKKSDIENE